MNTFIQYIYLWHVYVLSAFLVAGVGSGVILSLTHKKRRSSTVIFCTLAWVFVFYPISMVGQYNRWQDNIDACQSHGDYVMLRGVCYKPVVDVYVPITTWTLNKTLSSEMKK